MGQLPSVGTWLAPRRQPAAKADAATALSGALKADTKSAQFSKRPSVGTWLTHLPPPDDTSVKQRVADIESSSASAVKSVQKWVHKPSIGTWLAPTPLKQDSAGESKTGSTPFVKKPSVGTWLAPRWDAAETTIATVPAFVATTGAKTASAAASSSQPAAVPACGQRAMPLMSNNLLGPGFATMGVRPGV